jgi:hypothetical protein
MLDGLKMFWVSSHNVLSINVDGNGFTNILYDGFVVARRGPSSYHIILNK